MSKRETMGLPGLPRKEKVSKSGGSTELVMGGADTANVVNAPEPKEKPRKLAKKAKGKSEEESTEGTPEVGEKKSLLKMSPDEIKEHFRKKKYGDDEPVDIKTMVFVPTNPSVNLLPKEVVEEYRAQNLTVKFAKIGGTLVFVFLALFGVSLLSSSLNQQEIQKLEEDAANLNVEISNLKPYETYKTTIDGKRTSLSEQMEGDLDVAAIINGLNTVGAQSGIRFTSINLDSTGASCTSADPFNTVSTIGCVSFSGEGEGASSIVRFFDAAENVEGFVNPYLPASGAVQSEEGNSQLEGSIGITSIFIADRYAELKIPIDEVLAQNTAEAAGEATEETATEEVAADGQ